MWLCAVGGLVVVVALLGYLALRSAARVDRFPRQPAERRLRTPARPGVGGCGEVALPKCTDELVETEGGGGGVALSVVVPAYNESLRLPAMLHEALDHLAHRAARDPAFTFELIVVDDGSSDGTTAVALEAASNPLLITNIAH